MLNIRKEIREALNEAAPGSLKRYTVYIEKFYGPNDREIEEIDVDARNGADAREKAIEIKKEMYDDDWKVFKVVERFGLYM